MITPAESNTWRRIPASKRMIVHERSGRSARRLGSLAGSSDWRRTLADRAGLVALTIGSARSLPSARPVAWPPGGVDRLVEHLSDQLPGLRALGVVTPRQHGRERLSMLARMTGNHVVVKVGGDDERLAHEGRVLDLLSANPLPGIATPDVITSGRIAADGRHLTYLVTTSIALRSQRPATDAPLRTFEADLAARLATLPRPVDGDDLVPVHGDLTPWNLRRTGRGLALFDWEAAGWGAPGSDLVGYRAACESIRPWWRPRIDVVSSSVTGRRTEP